MKRLRWLGAILALPLAVALVTSVGCSGDKTGKTADAKRTDGKDAGKTGGDAGGGDKIPPKAGEKEPLVAKGWGSLKGKVTFDGTPPKPRMVEVPAKLDEKDQCLKGDMRDQTWKIGPDKGVANVIVWLKAPRGKFFQIPEDQRKPDPEFKLDQPLCAFEPHVFTLFPTYYDGADKKQKPTGQKFLVANSANFNHNTKLDASDELLIIGFNELLKSKAPPKEVPVQASKAKDSGGEVQIKFSCNIHGWMNAYARVFDHPYTAVSNGDKPDAKDFGTYEIKKVPAGVDVDILYWHESMKAPQRLKENVVLKDGENVENITIK